MTDPAPKSRTRRGGLYVTDAEIVERLNVPEKIAYQAIRALDANRISGFPKKQALWGNRRYWPAVEKWLDRQNGMEQQASFPQERRRA
jgi:hypothetical protein